MSVVLRGATLVLLAAHVTVVVRGVTPWYFVAPALGLSSIACLLVLPSHPPAFRTNILVHVGLLLVAWGVGAISVYTTAYALSSIVVWWIDLAYAAKLTTPDHPYNDTVRSIVTLSAVYASIRTVSHVLVREVAWIPDAVEYLAPAVLATLESCVMLFHSRPSYTFDTPTYHTYALHKAALALALPMIEASLR